VVKTLRLPLEKVIEIANKLNFRHEDNTIIAVIQDKETKEVLMVGHMNREALIKTLTTGYLYLWSKTRKKLWLKGETSGNYQIVEDVRIDCDEDAVVIQITSLGPICHTGNRSCFYRTYRDFLENINK